MANIRARNFKNLAGQIFEKWSVIGPYKVIKTHIGKSVTLWLCRCECGKEKFVRAAQLVYGSTTGCKLCGSRKLPFGESARRTVLKQYINEARERNLIWDLEESLFDSITKQNCSYCGAEPSNKRNLPDGSSFIFTGIDRVNNLRGYEADNVVSCCRNCNRAKDVMSKDEFILWATRVVQYQGLKG